MPVAPVLFRVFCYFRMQSDCAAVALAARMTRSLLLLAAEGVTRSVCEAARFPYGRGRWVANFGASAVKYVFRLSRFKCFVKFLAE